MRPRDLRTALACAATAAVLVAAIGCSDDSGGTSTSSPSPSTAPEGSTPATATTTTAAAPAPEYPERVGTDAEFYAVPSPIADVRHGTLLRYQAVQQSLTFRSRSWRIMYASRSLEGEPIVVTGLAAVPQLPAPDGGRATLTIAHGTSGIADECAPSLEPGGGESGLATHARAHNWLLAVSDYEGLGTPGRHPYLVGPSEGRAVLDAARAAGQLPGAGQGDQLLIAGYSQGGHGAAWAHQLAPTWGRGFDVLGTFAGAPASEIDLIVRAASQRPEVGGFVMMIIAGFAEAYPELDVADVLTPEGRELLDVVDEGCTSDVFAALAGTGRLVREDAAEADDWMDVLAESNPGNEPAPSPVLIIHSAQDEVVPAVLSDLMAQRMCEHGQVVERRVLEDGGGHIQAAGPAYSAAIAWFEGLLAGNEPVSTCP